MKRKTLLIALLAISICVLMAILVACTPDKMENIVGTYKLTTDKRTEYQQETVDTIQAYGKEAYLVITGKDYGYYVYKDKDTPVSAKEVKLEYTINDKNQVTLVSFTTDVGEKPKTFHVDSKKEIMLVSRLTESKIWDGYDITYTKISDKTDLSTVKKMYPDVPVYQYGLYKFNSAFCAELGNGLQKNYSEYIYKYYDVNSANCTATLYYALRSDKTPVVQTNLTVTFTRNPENEKVIKMTIGDVEYDLESGVPAREVKVNVDGEECDVKEEMGWFSLSQTEYSDYPSYFQSLIDEYENSLKESQPTE